LDELVATGDITDSTAAQYRACWTGTLRRAFAHLDVNDLTRRDAQEGLRALRRRDQKGDLMYDANGKTIPLFGSQPRTVLKMLLNYAADQGMRRDHVSVLAGTKTPKRKKAEPRALTPAEWQHLIDLAAARAVKTARSTWDLHDALLLMHYTGTRIGEACATEWANVYLDEAPPNILIERTTRERRKGVNPLGPTKGKKKPRYALHPRVEAMLRRRLSAWDGRTPFVFGTGKHGKPVQSGNLRTRLRAIVEGTDLDWVHPHSLRHTLATMAERQGGLAVAAELLTHSDQGAIAAKHYVEVDGTRVLDPRGLFEE
jgi:integrase